MHHCRKGLVSRILDQLDHQPLIIDSLQDLVDFTLELDTRYHERQKEKNHFQEKKSKASKPSFHYTQNSSSSSCEKKNFRFQKRDKPHSSLLNKVQKMLLKKKYYLKRACVPIVVGIIVLRLVSKGLKTRLRNQKADFPAREYPE
ncbi:hypothetical protein O181_128182 [Austropuccinia psidii MF-1]|uniref:Uncharacterized protein n=1 Tax=Austropuccinia psidii MF-1 TaxID=1389203 RepID=A0A9Q3KZC6_9BASI|nr:hypothetical protein [Austropuccinia psidii MF-1]